MQFKDITVTKYHIEKNGETPMRLAIDGAPRRVPNQEPMEDELVAFPGN
jgi:hypothetical protein